MNEEEFNQAPFEDFRQPNPVEDLIFKLADQRRRQEENPLTQAQGALSPPQGGPSDNVMAFIEQMLNKQPR